MDFSKINTVFEQYGIELKSDVAGLLEVYWEKVKIASEITDLTKITIDEEAWAKHFLDSFAPILFQKQYAYTIGKKGGVGIDIGTGAGFPGVPLGFYFSEMTWYLVDARNKKINFLDQTLKEMKQNQFRPVHCRIEDLIRTYPQLNQGVNVITARAIKLETDLLKEIYNLLSIDGLLIQYAGPSATALPFFKNKVLDEVIDFCPRLHSMTENHRVRVFRKSK